MPAINQRVSWVSLSDAATGFVFCSTHSITGSRWPWISTCVAEAFECDADALDCAEDDSGREFVTLRGEPLAEIHYARLSGNVAGLAEAERVAA